MISGEVRKYRNELYFGIRQTALLASSQIPLTALHFGESWGKISRKAKQPARFATKPTDFAYKLTVLSISSFS
jgi:hypothetical protein|tara:strand:+ start:3310 stop:3528 length:219 start_codon:yes stop_codon:yes gene_type:complete